MLAFEYIFLQNSQYHSLAKWFALVKGRVTNTWSLLIHFMPANQCRLSLIEIFIKSFVSVIYEILKKNLFRFSFFKRGVFASDFILSGNLYLFL